MEFERACDALLLSDKDITPLLVHYDQIRRDTDIYLPSEQMLKLDQHFFRELITKMRKAHQYELRQVKREYLKTAEEMVTKEVARVQAIVKDEFLRFAECQELQKDYSAG